MEMFFFQQYKKELMEKKQEITGAEMFELSVSLAPCNSDSLPSNKITIKLTRDHASNVRISLKKKETTTKTTLF